MKRKEIYAQNTSAIYAAIARLSRYLYFRETRLSKHTLAEPLEGIGFNTANDIKQLFSPISFRYVNIFGVGIL